MQTNGHAGADVLNTGPATADFELQPNNNRHGNGNIPPTPTAAAGRPRPPNPFTKAVKYNAKGRVALIGPAGGGKSFTALVLARALAGPNGKIAAIDTEHGSLSKYADLFDFDVMELDSFSPTSFIDALHAAEQAGYDVFLCDSLSHFWTGKDGAFDFVDMAAKRHKDQMGGWKDFRPHERLMVDELITSSCHVICTMRTKTDYHDQEDAQGRKKRVKIGPAPVQREGLEYEFDLVRYMDEDHTFAVDKTRCPAYSEKAYTKPGPKQFAPFVEWLKGAAREPRLIPVAPQTDSRNQPLNARDAAQHVAEQKLATGNLNSKAPWKNMRELTQSFQAIRERVGEVAWLQELDRYGWRSFQDMRNAIDLRSGSTGILLPCCYQAKVKCGLVHRARRKAVHRGTIGYVRRLSRRGLQWKYLPAI